MRSQPIMIRAAALGLVGIVLLDCAVQAAEVRVVSSGGFAAAYRVLGPEFERQTGHTLITAWGPSMGTTVDAVPARLARGEPIDVLIMVGYALAQLVEKGTVAAGSRSATGASGGRGAPKPGHVRGRGCGMRWPPIRSRIRTARAAYISAMRYQNAWARGADGRQSPDDPRRTGRCGSGAWRSEIGFQQISELKPIAGIVRSPLPPSAADLRVVSRCGRGQSRTGSRPRADPVPHLDGSCSRHRGERHGADGDRGRSGSEVSDFAHTRP